MERAIGAAQTENATKLTESVHEFEQLNELVTEEILQAEAFAKEAITLSHTMETKQRFRSIESGLREIEASHATYATHAEELFEIFDAGRVHGAEGAIEKIEAEERMFDDHLEEFLGDLESFTANATLNAEHTEQAAFRNLVIPSVVGLLLGLVVGFFLSRSIVGPIRRAGEIMQRIAGGDFSSEIQVMSSDEVGQLTAHMGEMQQKLKDRIEADRAALVTSGRVKQALDNVDGNVMITDADLNIVYMNEAVTLLFRDAEADFREGLPNFDASTLLGSCIDVFHKNPDHQRGLLERLTTTHTAEIEVGGRTMKIVANPVLAEDGERLGAVVEWTDRTAELEIESEVQHVVDSALAGDLNQRIAMKGKDGFFATLSQGVNQLVEVSERMIEDTVRVLGAMASGDLTETIDDEYQGSYGQLKHYANTTVTKLTEVVGNIQLSSASVKTGADEISQGNTDLSQRTEEQASSLEETASSMEEMTSTVKQNADNASQANQLAIAAREQAQKGGMVVEQAVGAMGEINASSTKISDIIGVIDEIAFQTNLLALNASVEAARAGDQGRGFAVVASEVRNLAGRSATAAKEIKDLIEDSSHKVVEGSRLVNESGEMLGEIVSGVKRVTDIVTDIVGEIATASESLGEQADDLDQMMTFFTVGDSTAVRAVSSPPSKGSETSRVDERVAGPAWQKGATENGTDRAWQEF